MSDVANAFIANIRTQTDIPEGLRTNIYPSVAPEEVLPVIVYELTDGIIESLYVGSFGLRTTTIVLNMYDLNYDNLTAAAGALERAYHGTSQTFTLGSGAAERTVDVQRIVMNDIFFTVQDGNDKVYRCTIEFDLIT